MRIAVIAALPRELAALTRGWRRIDTAERGVWLAESEFGVAACAGMGCNRVSKAVAAALASGGSGIDRLLSVGLAGGCGPTVPAGEVLRFRTVVDVRSGERFTSDEGDGVLATAGVIAGVAEKRRLFESYGAAAVDMEAACVARLARAHGLRFSAIKGISDDASLSLDGLDRFATADGQFREIAFALHTALRPTRWRAAMQLGRNSAAALRSLTTALQDELAKQGSER